MDWCTRVAWRFCISRVKSNCMCTIMYLSKHAEVYVVKSDINPLEQLNLCKYFAHVVKEE
jgi:hypothetical protein